MNIVPVLLAAQAQQQAAERALLDTFRVADATAPDRAQSLTRLGLERTDAFTRLEQAGVLRSDGRDRYHLAETALIARRAARPTASLRHVVIVVVLVAVAVIGLAVVLSNR